MAELSGIPTAPDAPEIVRRTSKEVVRPGQIIAQRYAVSSRLGAGGMGAVYRVHDQVLEEDVALKVILPEALGDPRAVERLRAEVKIARKITHPNVCRVFDLGEADGLLFLTMELVEGRTLRQAIKAGGLSRTRSLEWFEQIVAGVAAAHAQGVVHRDLKPENILLRNDEQCVVADFGLARGTEGEGHIAVDKAGTPAYMSPEQRRGDALDVRSDVYALGLIGRELLGEVSGAWGEVLARALADRAEDRYASARELGLELRRVGAGEVSEGTEEKVPGSIVEVDARPSSGFSDAGGTSNSPPNAAQTAGSPHPHRKTSAEVIDASETAVSPKVPGTFRWLALLLGAVAIVAAARSFVFSKNVDSPTSTPAPSASVQVSNAPVRATVVVLPFENLTADTAWDGLSQSAPESLRGVLRTLPNVVIVDRDAQPHFSIRGNIQRVGNQIRLFAQMEPLGDPGDVPPSEPVEVDIKGDAAPALETLRSKLLDEARIVLARYDRRQRAITQTSHPVAREKLLAYYRLIGPAPRSEHFEPGLSLLEDAIALDPDYVPARIERVFLWMNGAIEGSGEQRYEKALAELNDVVRTHPDEPETLVMRCRVAQGLVERVDHPRDTMIDRAMVACTEALTAAPLSAHVHVMLARMYDRRCDVESAMRAASRATELDRSLSGRTLSQIVYNALANGQVLVADKWSAELWAFQQEAEKLGAKSLSRRAGAPEARGVYAARGSVLLALERYAEAEDIFSRELARLAENRGSAVDEATAIRGLMRAAAGAKKDPPNLLVSRLEAIERTYHERLRTNPEDVQILARTYQFVDPQAAVHWIERLTPPTNCEDALQRAHIYHSAGKPERVRDMLAKCLPTENWEKNCITQLTPPVGKH